MFRTEDLQSCAFTIDSYPSKSVTELVSNSHDDDLFKSRNFEELAFEMVDKAEKSSRLWRSS